MAFRSETKAAEELRVTYQADLCHGVWDSELPSPEEPPSNLERAAPIWALSEIEHGRLYIPNNTCWLGYALQPSERELDGQCADSIYALRYLEDLLIDGGEIDKAVPLRFDRMTHLKRLTLFNIRLSANETASISQLGNLQSLVLESCTVEDTAFSCFTKLHKLERLFFSGTNTHGYELALIGRLENLRELSLSDNAITDEGLEALEEMRYLQKLYLPGSGIKGNGLMYVDAAPLEWLDLQLSQVDDDGVSTIARCFPKLKYLNLTGTPISDSCVPHLLQLDSLEVLSISLTNISPTATKRLRAAIGCTVYADN